MLASCQVEDPLLGSGSAPVAAGFYGPFELSVCEVRLHILETVLGETPSLMDLSSWYWTTQPDSRYHCFAASSEKDAGKTQT